SSQYKHYCGSESTSLFGDSIPRVSMASSLGDDSDWKLRISVGKVAVCPLNQATDFAQWHLALRRLVTVCGMADSLLSPVPSNQMAAVKERIQAAADSVRGVKKEADASESKDSPLSDP